MQRFAENFARRALLGDARGIHDVDAVGVTRHHAEIVRDDDECNPQFARQVLHQFQDLRLYGHVERGGRFVGDQQFRIAREPDRYHHALAHAARKLVRILVKPAIRIGNADHLQQIERAGARRRLVHVEMDHQRFHDLEPDGQHRVQRRHRLLEDHRDIAAANLAHFVFSKLEKIAPLEQDAAADDAACRLGQQPHDGE